MKQTVAVIAVVGLGILAGCTGAKVAYRSKATLVPAPDAGQYDIAFVIEDVADPGNPSVVGCPRIRLLTGKEGSVSVGDDASAIQCTAVVDESSGKPEAKTTVSVTKNGKVVWSDTQTVAMSK